MKNAMKFCLTLLASLLFIGAANTLQAQEDGVASEIDNFVAKWQEDYNKADVDGLLSHYSEDAIQIRETGEELKGADAIAANYKAFFDGMTAKADIKVGEVYKVADDAGQRNLRAERQQQEEWGRVRLFRHVLDPRQKERRRVGDRTPHGRRAGQDCRDPEVGRQGIDRTDSSSNANGLPERNSGSPFFFRVAENPTSAPVPEC